MEEGSISHSLIFVCFSPYLCKNIRRVNYSFLAIRAEIGWNIYFVFWSKSTLKFDLCALSRQPRVSKCGGSSHARGEEDWRQHFLIEPQTLSKDGVVILASLGEESAHAKRKKKKKEKEMYN